MDEESEAVVNAIMHMVGFENSLDSRVVERIASSLLVGPLWSLTPDEEYRAIADALNSRRVLGRGIGANFSDSEIRGLLARVVDRMDEARPWPVLPFSILPGAELESFPGEPIAWIRISWPRIESKFKKTFRRSVGGCQYLAVRLRSGAEVAFSWRPDDSVTSILSADRTLSAPAVIDEIVAATELTDEDIVRL